MGLAGGEEGGGGGTERVGSGFAEVEEGRWRARAARSGLLCGDGEAVEALRRDLQRTVRRESQLGSSSRRRRGLTGC